MAKCAQWLFTGCALREGNLGPARGRPPLWAQEAEVELCWLGSQGRFPAGRLPQREGAQKSAFGLLSQRMTCRCTGQNSASPGRGRLQWPPSAQRHWRQPQGGGCPTLDAPSGRGGSKACGRACTAPSKGWGQKPGSAV